LPELALGILTKISNPFVNSDILAIEAV